MKRFKRGDERLQTLLDNILKGEHEVINILRENVVKVQHIEKEFEKLGIKKTKGIYG